MGSNFKNKSIDNYKKLNYLLQFLVGHKGYIAGGVFKNIFNGGKIKDIDIFFYSKDDYDKAAKHFKGSSHYTTHYSNNKVEAFRNSFSGVIVELIKYKFITPEQMLKEFDFTITKFALIKTISKDESGDEIASYSVTMHNDFFEHLHEKRLIIDQPSKDILFPISTINRMFRYVKYGYGPCLGTKKKIIQALRELENYNPDETGNNMYNGID